MRADAHLRNEADPFTTRVLDALRRARSVPAIRPPVWTTFVFRRVRSPSESRRARRRRLRRGDVADALADVTWIEELVRYVEDGGVFVAHGEGDEIAEVFSWFGAPWTFGGDYLRASYEFNHE